MKKLFSLFVLMAFLITLSHAQVTTMTLSGDTVVNTGTKFCSLRLAQSYKKVTVQALITKISGTVAGTLTLQGSIDGTNWVTADTASFVTEGAATFTATNVATQNKTWIMNGDPYLWYRLSYTGTGTMSATLKGYVLPRGNE